MEVINQTVNEAGEVDIASQEGKDLYRIIAENFPNGAVLLFDRDLRYTLADGLGLAEVGLSREMLEGKTIWELFPPEVCGILEPRYRSALAGKSSTFEVQFAGRIYQIHSLPIPSEQGEILNGMAMTQDITEQKKVEESLRKSQMQYEQLVNSIDGIVWEGDAQTFQYSFVSKQAERILGYPVELWTSEPNFWSDHIYPEDREWAVNFCALSTAQKRDHVFDYRMVAADGRLVWLRDIVSVVLENGQPVTLRGVMVDITESKRMEAELKEREEQYRSIFESVSDALFINDIETGEIVDFNPAASRMHGYTDEEFRQLEIGAFVHPDSKDLFYEYLRTVRAGGVFRARAMDVRKNGSAFPIEVLGTSFKYRGKPHTLGVVRDITEEMKAYQVLEERVIQRTKELQTLLEVSRNVASTLELEALFATVFEQIKKVVDFTAIAVWMVEGEDALSIAEYQGPLPREKVFERWNGRFHLSDLEPHRDVKPIIIPDVRADTPEASYWRAEMIRWFDEIPDHISTWMSIPLIVKDRLIGLISFHHQEANAYTSRQAELALALANHMAVAIENARLFQTVQHNAEQFRAISEMGQRITSILNVDELLSQTVHLIQDTFGYYHVHIGLIEGDEVLLPAAAGVWEDEPVCNYCATLNLRLEQEAICSQVAGTGETIVVPDVSREPRYLHPHGATGSGAVIPLMVKGAVIGLLDVESKRANAFDESDVAVLQSLANQVAVAIENARLYEQAQRLAALQERQKLARELHDSVSQALYGLALGTRTARTLLDRDPQQAAEPLDYCLELAEAGLAEMRALIFELRPESLENEGLVAALGKQAAAVQARYNLKVDTRFCPEPEVPISIKEALYRIAQEALNNAVKHASATWLQLILECTDGELCLEVEDNGCGFAPQRDYPGHLGLKSMRERAERLHGQFEIESAPGRGTRLRVTIPISPAHR